MTITAQIIAHSVSPDGVRLTTMQLRMPHFILPQLTRHRVFSFGVSSSRAVPVKRMIEEVLNDPVDPRWGSNKPGMQPGGELTGGSLRAAQRHWHNARAAAIISARGMADVGAAKEAANRALEPYSHVNLIITGTEWDNFYALRRHGDAQHEIHELADRMYEAQEASVPYQLYSHEWHLPYITAAERLEYGIDMLLKLSTARCARVSYGSKATIASDLKLYDRLMASDPPHASPTEHQATPHEAGGANFRGWMQHRGML